MLDEDVRSNSVSYPDSEFIAEKTDVFVNLSDDANETMSQLWTEMKSETANKWFVPIFLVSCITIIAFVLIRRHNKRKKDIF